MKQYFDGCMLIKLDITSAQVKMYISSKDNGNKLHHPTLCFSILPAFFCLPDPLPFLSVYHKMTRCLSSFSLKPVRSSCCGRGGSGVKLFPPRARRRACSLDEQAAAWSQSSQVSALRGEQFCGADNGA